jgi:hypothetical protein
VGAGFRRAAKVLDRECRLKAYPMSHSAFRQLMMPHADNEDHEANYCLAHFPVAPCV